MHLTLISIYYYVCERYNSTLRWDVQRFSSNSNQGEITDEELITIYLFCAGYQERYKIKSMHKYIAEHWADWFPKLPTYQCFNERLNRICELFPALVSCQVDELQCLGEEVVLEVADSMPIITCSANRQPKSNFEMVDKGYCASKKLHYYGVKLHALCTYNKGELPLPEYIGLTPASTHDLTALRPILKTIKNRNIIADKAYADKKLNQELIEGHNSQIITPIKQVKGKPLTTKQFDKAYEDLFSTAVSKIRQPIESLFHWINDMTGIQKASKVRSHRGLIVHVFGKIAAALCLKLNF